MNERIRELIEQATESKGFLTAGDSVKPLPVREFNKEKFAELIVKECSNKIEDQKATAAPQVAAGLNFAQVIIKEHFYGVE